MTCNLLECAIYVKLGVNFSGNLMDTVPNCLENHTISLAEEDKKMVLFVSLPARFLTNVFAGGALIYDVGLFNMAEKMQAA